jgi:hypothetical protein
MSSICDDSEDTIVVEQPALEADLRSRASSATPRSGALGVRAYGTGEQRVLTRDPERPRARSCGTRELAHDPDTAPAPPRGTRELDRDPAEVLRMWPHSAGALERGGVAIHPGAPAPSSRGRFEDTLARAYLALDRYREHAAQRAAAPMERSGRDICDNRGCVARADALRGALVSACALVQRAALVTPDPIGADELEDRLRELLELVDP